MPCCGSSSTQIVESAPQSSAKALTELPKANELTEQESDRRSSAKSGASTPTSTLKQASHRVQQLGIDTSPSQDTVPTVASTPASVQETSFESQPPDDDDRGVEDSEAPPLPPHVQEYEERPYDEPMAGESAATAEDESSCDDAEQRLQDEIVTMKARLASLSQQYLEVEQENTVEEQVEEVVEEVEEEEETSRAVNDDRDEKTHVVGGGMNGLLDELKRRTAIDPTENTKDKSSPKAPAAAAEKPAVGGMGGVFAELTSKAAAPSQDDAVEPPAPVSDESVVAQPASRMGGLFTELKKKKAPFAAGGMGVLLAQLKTDERNDEPTVAEEKKKEESNSTENSLAEPSLGGMAGDLSQIKTKKSDDEKRSAAEWAEQKEAEPAVAKLPVGGMGGVFAELKLKKSPLGGGMGGVFAELKSKSAASEEKAEPAFAPHMAGLLVQIKTNDEDKSAEEEIDVVKYQRMLRMGLPEGAVRQALERDGVESWRVFSEDKKVPEESAGPALKDDPVFAKYFKMIKMGLPQGAVMQAMERDGTDAAALSMNPEKSYAEQKKQPSGPPLKDDPNFAKYFKMVKMGLPRGAVVQAMEKDGVDPAALDMDREKSYVDQKAGTSDATAAAPKPKKPRVRRTRVNWAPIKSAELKETSLWSNLTVSLEFDDAELKELFTESAEKTKGAPKPITQTAKKKKDAQVIEGKRSMDGCIILQRLKIAPHRIAEMIDGMEHGGQLDITSLKSLKGFLPTDIERKGLIGYMQRFGKTEEEKEAAYEDLSMCERYMYEMTKIPDAAAKFECLLFRATFKQRFHETNDSIQIVSAACDEARNSVRLHNVLGITLALLNRIKTDDEDEREKAFGIETLLRLGEAKAFDKKTTVLTYLVRLIQKKDASLLDLRNDLVHSFQADSIILSTVAKDLEGIEKDVAKALATAKKQADEKETTDEDNSSSIPEEDESESDEPLGRTPMECFAMQASSDIAQATMTLDGTKNKYTSLLDYFGEDKKMASNEFFGTLRSFMNNVKLTVDVLERERKAAEREKRKAGGGGSPKTTPQKVPKKPDRGSLADLASLAANQSFKLKKTAQSARW